MSEYLSNHFDQGNILTVDGKRGAGKSRLAADLRDVFQCSVLELGPLFRVAAWLIGKGYASGLAGLADCLGHLVNVGMLQVRLDVPGRLAAMEVRFNGDVLDGELWSPSLHLLVRTCAEAEPVSNAIGLLALRLTRSTRRVVVVGREAGSRFFPAAGLKIILCAESSVRLDRKTKQLEAFSGLAQGTELLEASEPMHRLKVMPSMSEAVSINTDQLPWTETLGQVVCLVHKVLQWSPDSSGKVTCATIVPSGSARYQQWSGATPPLPSLQ